MVSVTAVETTPDLRYAKVYVSVLDKERRGARCVKGLKSAGGYLRRELGRALQLRYTPELQCCRLDDSIDKGAHILELLRSVEVAQGRKQRPGAGKGDLDMRSERQTARAAA